MGPDPQLQRAVVDVMSWRDDRAERRPWGLRSREDGHAASHLQRDQRGHLLRGRLGGALRAVPGLALGIARRAIASSGWQR